MKRAAALVALALLLAPQPARAQDDDETMAPRRSDEGAESDAPRPSKRHAKRSRGDVTAEEELSEAPDPTLRRMAREDDPRIGLGVELTLSLALLDKTAGPGVQGQVAGGVRINWAPGVLFTEPDDDFWRNALLVELGYDYLSSSDGTKLVNTKSGIHDLNAHVLLGYPAQKVLLFYGLLGPGMTVETVTYAVGTDTTPLTGIKFNLAYGLGARLNLPVSDRFAFATRMELCRYRRGDFNDTFLTFSLGGAF